MANNAYSKAYKEVLEIIKYFPEKEYNKIPKEKIEYYRDNMDKDYEFTIDPTKDLYKQNISREANAIIVSIYLDYFATEEQKQKIKEILELNEKKQEIEKREKYNPNDLFKKEKENIKADPLAEETALVNYKESFFERFKKFIYRLFNI